MVSTPRQTPSAGKQEGPSRPPSPSPSTSSVSSASSRVLAAKLHSLDQNWSAHKAKTRSPIKSTPRNKRPHAKRRPEPSPGSNRTKTIVTARTRSNRSATQQTNVSGMVGQKNDDDSVGDNSVSTLGSTESVFDRLYRQSIRTPRIKTPDKNRRVAGSSASGSRRSSFGSPVIRNKKDRLGAYGKSPIINTKSAGYGDKTPRRRTNQSNPSSSSVCKSSERKSSDLENIDTSSVASSISEVTDCDGNASVFNRLYHNSKRTEKLWKKPKQFTPILSPSSNRKSRRSHGKKSRGSADKAAEKLKDQQQQNQSKKAEDTIVKKNKNTNIKAHTILEKDCEHNFQMRAQLGNGEVASNSSTNLEQCQQENNKLSEEYLATSLAKDLKAVNEIGALLPKVYSGCSPTVAGTSVSSTNWEDGFVVGIRCISQVATSANKELNDLVAVDNQLETTKAEQEEFLCSTVVSNKSTNQDQPSVTHHASVPVMHQSNVAVASENDSCVGALSHKEGECVEKVHTTGPPSSNDTISSKSSASDNSGFFSLKSNRSYTVDQAILRKKILFKRADHSSPSIYRKHRDSFEETTNRTESAITIQKAWRVNRAELQLASSMIHSWDSNIQFECDSSNLRNYFIHKQQALEQAVRAAKCWWILEGLVIKDNWITIVWENEVHVGGGDIRVKINLTCGAKSLLFASRHWDSMKLALLLVKASLKKEIRKEYSARLVAERCQQSNEKTDRSATVLQRWYRKQKQRNCRKEHEQPFGNISDNTEDITLSSIPKDINFSSDDTTSLTRGEKAVSVNQNEAILSSPEVLPLDLYEKVIEDIPTKTMPLVDTYLYEHHLAATKIQCFLRLIVLKAAVKEWPSAMGQLRAALQTAGSLSWSQTNSLDEFKAARNILCNTIIAKHLSGARCSSVGASTSTNSAFENEFISQRAASRAIHNIVRAHLIGLKKYRDKKRAILIQATFRGYSTRKRLELEEFSAVVIQFAWSNCRYIGIRSRNATKIQKLFRMVIYRRNYEMSRFCIIYIQAGWRRAIAGRRLTLVRSACTLIQRIWRRSRDRNAYLKFYSAIRSIQYRFRIQLTVKMYRTEYYAASIVQSWWRGRIARLHLLKSLDACICIQSHVRSLIQCRKFHNARFDVIMIQRTLRTFRCLKQFESQKRSALQLQTLFRKSLSINCAERRRQSIIDIQRVYRGHTCKNILMECVQNATTVQKYWRRHREHVSYLNTIIAVTIVQSFARFIITRHRFLTSCQAIIDLQRVIRGWHCRNQIPFYREEAQKALAERQLFGAITVQRMWRTVRERQRYKFLLQSTILLQKIARKIQAQSLYTKRRNAAWTIQARWKTMVAESRLRKFKLASIKIQCFWRVHAASQFVNVIRMKKFNSSSVIIQSMWRGTIRRHEFAELRIATILVQTLIRRKLAMNSMNILLEERLKNNTSILIQSQWRSAVARESYAVARVAVIMIQASARRMLTVERAKALVRQNTCQEASILIQTKWRGLKRRERYQQARASAIIIQAHMRRILGSKIGYKLMNIRLSQASILVQRSWRGVIARKNFLKIRSATTIIQAHARMMNAVNNSKALKYEKSVQKSSILIQSAWRGAMGRYHFYEALFSAITIQTNFRRMIGSNRAKLRRTCIQSARFIQSHWRGAITRDRYSQIRVAAIMIQASLRGMLTRRRHKLIQKCTILIQSTWRGAMCRYQYYEGLVYLFSAITIQAALRRMVASKQTKRLRATIHAEQARKREEELKFREATESSTLIQSHWRACQQRSKYMQCRVAAILIQAFVRGYLAIQQFHLDKARKREEELKFWEATESSTLIQSQWRGSCQRYKYMLCRVAAISIQAFVRGFFVRKEMHLAKARQQRDEERKYIKATESSTLIQSHWRAFQQSIEYMLCRVAAISIQAFVRGFFVRKEMHLAKARQQRDEERKCIKAAESSTLIQSQWRGSRQRYKYMLCRVAAISIQALVRGYVVRKQIYLDKARQQREEALKTEELKYWKATESSLMIQSNWRGSLRRTEFMTFKVAAISIQALVRGFVVRKEIHLDKARQQRMEELKYKEYNESSILIQSHWRASQRRSGYMQYKVAAIMIQASARGAFIRTQYKYKSNRGSIIFIQKMVRAHLCRKHLYELHAAAIQIQRVWKGNVAVRMYRKVTESTTMIQSQWRASKTRGEFAAMIIQAMTRGAQVRSQWRFVRMLSKRKKIFNVSARRIQVAFILWRMNIALWEVKSLAVLLKRGIRGQLARSVIHYALIHMNSLRNSMTIESFDRVLRNKDTYRGISGMIAWHTAVSDIRTSASILIQSYVRTFMTRNQVMEEFGFVFDKRFVYETPTAISEHAAIAIQQSFREWLKLRSSSAVLIQKSARGWISWITYNNVILPAHHESRAMAATKIQTIHRYRKQRYRFTLRKGAIVQIQTVWRGFQARKLLKNYEAQRCLMLKAFAILKLQALYRARKQRVRFLVQRKGSLKIQNFWRRVFTRKSFIKWKTAAGIIQMTYRYYRQRKAHQYMLVSCVVKVQSLARKLTARRMFLERRRMFEIQAELSLNHFLEQTRDVSASIAEDLLTNSDSMTNGPCMRRLADRVNDTLREAKLASDEVVPDFVHRFRAVIPLPSTARKPASPALLRSKSTDTDTPVRGNRAVPNKAAPETKIDHTSTSSKPVSPVASSSGGRNVFRTAGGAGNVLANHEFELLRERTTRKNRADASLPQRTPKPASPDRNGRASSLFGREEKPGVPGGDPHHGRASSEESGPDDFGERSNMPSPIRSKETEPGWDWSSSW